MAGRAGGRDRIDVFTNTHAMVPFLKSLSSTSAGAAEILRLRARPASKCKSTTYLNRACSAVGVFLLFIHTMHNISRWHSLHSANPNNEQELEKLEIECFEMNVHKFCNEVSLIN